MNLIKGFLKEIKSQGKGKINSIKMFLKEIKRIRWTKIRNANKDFVLVLIFVTIAALTLFGLAIGFTSMWNSWGVGIDG